MPLGFLLALSLIAPSSACSPSAERSEAQLIEAGVLDVLAPADPVRTPLTPAERSFYMDAAELAWRYLDGNYQEATGLVNGTPEWQYTTIWDIGAQLLAFLAAKELNLLTPEDYARRMQVTLTSLEHMQLFRGVAFNKSYSTRDASMGDISGRVTGWSATDLGRLLVALKVLAMREPQYAAAAERIARRIDFDEVVRGGYLHGQLIGSSGAPWTFQEGRIGYEQYVATGFQLWGARVDNALDLSRNGEPVDVLGVRLLRDRRRHDRLVSEPFILLGLELGMKDDMHQLAAAVLAAQKARYDSLGRLTIASEDAVGVPPHYFYYYCVYCNRKPFSIDVAVPGREVNVPRWVSTKGAFGWHALMPSDYTRKALEYVRAARNPTRGWASGVFEESGASTETYDVNTASVILEVAAFQLRGWRPLIEEPALPMDSAAAAGEAAATEDMAAPSRDR
jgi:hypothetical protein